MALAPVVVVAVDDVRADVVDGVDDVHADVDAEDGQTVAKRDNSLRPNSPPCNVLADAQRIRSVEFACGIVKTRLKVVVDGCSSRYCQQLFGIQARDDDDGDDGD